MKVEVLGNVQDGGVPHLGCSCDVCESARENREEIKYASSLLLKENDTEDSVRYLVGATADIRFQITGEYLDGIMLVDNHFTHLTGLLFLGEFSLESSDIPVYGPEFMQEHLMRNDPFRYLLDKGNINTIDIEEDEEFNIQGAKVTPQVVSHRRETTGTLTYYIEGPEKDIFYAPIIYKEWEEREINLIQEADIAIIEGCFYKPEEIDRFSEELPHPTIPETMEKLEGVETEVYFTHLNHTNPALREDSEERKKVEEKGFQIAEKGKEFKI